MKSGMPLKVAFEGCNYLVDEFPSDYKDMVRKVSAKLNRQLGRDFSLSFIDNENEKIVFSDDSDLAFALKMAVAENRKSLKIIVEKLPCEKAGGSEKNTLTSSEEAPFVAFDPLKYLKFLELNLPKFNSTFEDAIGAHKLPCEECFGVGHKKSGANCENCHQTGLRPITPQIKLLLKLMDYKFKKLIMEPLRMFACGEDKEKESDRILEEDFDDLEDLFIKDLHASNKLSKSSNKLGGDSTALSKAELAKPDSSKRSVQQSQILPSTVINPQRKSSHFEEQKLDFLGTVNKPADPPKEQPSRAYARFTQWPEATGAGA